MAVPLIITVSPSGGVTTGARLVELKTNNARLPPPPPATGPTSGVVPQTVEVLFGDIAAEGVKVISRGRVLCLAPVQGAGVVGVTITNLDDDGEPIPGETFTKPDAYTYSRPSLSAETESDFVRLIRTFVLDLQQQVHANVGITTHTDFDAETGDFLNIAEMSEMPGLILIGPDVTENRLLSRNAPRLQGSSTEVQISRPPYTVDLTFTIVGFSDLTRQMLELMHATMQYFHRNKYLRVACPAAPMGYAKYEIDFVEEGGEPNATTRLGESNVRSFSGTVVIRGFNLEDFAGIPDDTVIDLAGRVTEVLVGVDPPLAIAEVEEDELAFPFDSDLLAAAPDVGGFELIIEEKE